MTLVYSSAGQRLRRVRRSGQLPPAIAGTASYWDASGNTDSCTFDPGGAPATFAVMGNAPNLCPSAPPALAAGYGQFLGPAQPIDFVVPVDVEPAVDQHRGGLRHLGLRRCRTPDTAVSPWTVPANILTRSATSFVNVFTALDTGVPAVGRRHQAAPLESTNTATAAALAALNSTTPESGIGFVSGEVADGDRKDIRVLAYQHTGQSCGYWPDSTVDAFDKANVRDGSVLALVAGALLRRGRRQRRRRRPEPPRASSGCFTGAVTRAHRRRRLRRRERRLHRPAVRHARLARRRSRSRPTPSRRPEPVQLRVRLRDSSNANKPASCNTCTQDSDCATQHCRNIGPPLATGAGSANVGYCEAY